MHTVFPTVQPERGTAPALLAPAVEPGSGRIVYAQLFLAQGGCTGDATTCDPTADLPAPPRLQAGRLRVRAPGATEPAAQDPTLSLSFDGVTFDDSQHPVGLPGVWITHLHPFQRRFNDEGLLPVRPSWDPIGGRLVTSDGLGLLLWRPGEATATSIPGTEDGSSPAWSPDRMSIAFTRLERGAELRTTCQHLSFGPTGTVVACIEDRTQWPIGRAMILLVSPVGGTPVELAEGTEPAWSPDGARVYFARQDGIWRIAAAGGAPERLPGTEAGGQPAVSPDGTELAFTRIGEDGKGDIWVVPLP